MLEKILKRLRIGLMRRYGRPARHVDGVPLYAQGLEDMHLLRIFGLKHKGFYVDVGSNDGAFVSNTCTLYGLGWRGISIEPNPIAFAKLKMRRPDDICLNLAIGNTEGTVELRWNQERTEGSTVRTGPPTESSCKASLTTLANILAEHNAPKNFELLSIDVEGMEQQVLQGINWDTHRPQLVILEYNCSGTVNHAAFDMLLQLGYRPVLINRWNVFMSQNWSEHLVKVHSRQDWFTLDRLGF